MTTFLDLDLDSKREKLIQLIELMGNNLDVIDFMSEENIDQVYESVTSALDRSDEIDGFGTEGWRHYFGFRE